MVYSPEMVALLQQLRSRVQAEFGVKIRLVDPNLLPSLGQMGHKSRDPFTRKTIVKVMEMAEIPYKLEDKAPQRVPAQVPGSYQAPGSYQDTGSNSGSREMTYRGTKIYRDKPLPPQHNAGSGTMSSPVKKQMYRGQVVNK